MGQASLLRPSVSHQTLATGSSAALGPSGRITADRRYSGNRIGQSVFVRRAWLIAVSIPLVVVLCGCIGPDYDGRHVAGFAIRFRNDLTHPVVLVVCNADGGARCNLIR